MISVQREDPASPDSQVLIEALSAVLAEITGDSGKRHFNAEDLACEKGVWAVARNKSHEALGCGAIRPLSNDVAELKRMYADGRYPGTGAELLAFLERAAAELGYREVWLETRHINRRAVAFYLKHGYRQRANYGPYVGRDEAVCFSKSLG